MRDLYFFFQAEDGIRDVAVTGVQTCALPIYFLDIGHSRDALDNDTKNHRRDHHANESDEGVAKRLEGDPGFWRKATNENASEDGDEYLNIKDGVPRLAWRRGLGGSHARCS